MIEELDYCGYFLTMHQIVQFCRGRRILCQGRGSAANSAVCYCLGVTAVDPVRRIGEIARREGMWHHVDAAYAGTAMICEEFRHHQDGLEIVDSYTFNPHKWMFTNFDCNVFYVADREPLIDAMSITPPYLRNRASDSGDVIDYRDWHVPLGRRFRALKLWFVLRSYGATRLREMVAAHIDQAREFADWVQDAPEWELLAPVPLNTVCFRRCPVGIAPREWNEYNRELLARVNADGMIYLTHTHLDEVFTLRLAVGQTNTRREHVLEAWTTLNRIAASLT